MIWGEKFTNSVKIMQSMLLSVLFCSLLPSTLLAQDYQVGPFFVFKSENALLLNGSIDNSSYDDFLLALDYFDHDPTLVLNSPGGNVATALQIGAFTSESGFVTYVPERAVCASACSLVFFSGRQRIAIGELGVHQMSSSSSSALAGVQYLIAEVLTAFARQNVDDRVIQRMLRTAPTDMYYFNEAEKDELGINVFDDSKSVYQVKSFTDYPAQIYRGKLFFPDFNGIDSWAAMYRTRITNGISEGVNFSGKFSIIEIGCGTNCRFVYLADVSSGRVYHFPYGGEDNYQLGLVYAADSQLIRATWRDSLEDGYSNCITQTLLWNNSAFEVIDEQRSTKLGYDCSIEY